MAMMEQEQARVGEHANSFGRIRASDIADSRMHLRGPDAARPIAHQPQQGGLFTYVSCEARLPEGQAVLAANDFCGIYLDAVMCRPPQAASRPAMAVNLSSLGVDKRWHCLEVR